MGKDMSVIVSAFKEPILKEEREKILKCLQCKKNSTPRKRLAAGEMASGQRCWRRTSRKRESSELGLKEWMTWRYRKGGRWGEWSFQIQEWHGPRGLKASLSTPYRQSHVVSQGHCGISRPWHCTWHCTQNMSAES